VRYTQSEALSGTSLQEALDPGRSNRVQSRSMEKLSTDHVAFMTSCMHLAHFDRLRGESKLIWCFSLNLELCSCLLLG